MKVVVAIVVLLVIFFGVNYSVTGNVVSGEDEAPGIFERLWNWFKGLFFEDVEESVESVAKVAVEILPGNVKGIGK